MCTRMRSYISFARPEDEPNLSSVKKCFFLVQPITIVQDGASAKVKIKHKKLEKEKHIIGVLKQKYFFRIGVILVFLE